MELSSPSIGDGYCQDENNNGACNYDGGDCCGSCIITEQCSQCQCLGGGETGGNDIPNPLIGDGYCQDEINNAECNYDGGDCCGACVVTVQCTECQCLGGVDGIDLSSPSIGDGYCQDGNNKYACGYDFGDCCGNANTEHCMECSCLSMCFQIIFYISAERVNNKL